METVPLIFNRRILRKHRDRAAGTLIRHDFLIKEAVQRITERFDGEITRHFPCVLDLGCRLGYSTQALQNKAGIQHMVQADISEKMVQYAQNPSVVADEELLPFAPESFDLIISVLNLHWVNDLPGCLLQIQRCLKKDGLFIAVMFGVATLKELRQASLEAEISLSGGISPRVSPFTEVKDAGRLLQRAGFALPVADTDTITVHYPDAFLLMQDLRGMGESAALVQGNKHFTDRTTLSTIAATYEMLFGMPDGKIPATFEFITLTGWKN